ncbi:AAA family ATPase [Paenibacillus lactis]|uniref:SpoVK/Ycf46/Vps4 family AAA+-type ATPase n=1 Tax=Paenibacillus lactis TaxID=228574 RepID=A0ABS4FAX0_9BACL|nr:ATP-binding protein [Paenibacillus lactis]MBP1893401.1 SpoVK/Ycf46/Vps4 family AAA+-type ATPase [Paenibacillus lactis]MCM3496294.1 ATP-binding protein [Paenibacillus lactis]HAG01351.1 ATPase [Paenibacillus lactis]
MSKSNASQRLPRAKGIDMANLYSPKDCAKKAKHLILSEVNQRIVKEFIEILGMREEFEQHGVPVPNKIVMYGPPGTGKTLTAFYMAKVLELPLVLVRLDAIIHSHLGETGSNIRKIFDYASAFPCVLFLDEFDAIARTRDNNDEVKEMARAVNTLLQCLDDFGDRSIIMAATNLEKDLDQAIWRRFDTKLIYTVPEQEQRKLYIEILIGEFEYDPSILTETCRQLARCSFADIEQIVLKAKRKAIIERMPLQMKHMQNAIEEYKPIIVAAY